MFNNGEITFYNNGWKIVIELFTLKLTDIQEIHDFIFEEAHNRIGQGDCSINWKAFEYNDPLWYADGSKAIRVIRKNDDTKTIWFKK